MPSSSLHFFPLAHPFLLALAVLVGVLIAFIEVGILGYVLILSRQSAPSLAYISGSLGTLIGADLLNRGKVHGLGAPIVSIGGGGTFDRLTASS